MNLLCRYPRRGCRMLLWGAVALVVPGFCTAGASAQPAYEYDAVLLVGGKPDGIDTPSLEMALRARAACNLLYEKKAYYLLIAGNEFNNSKLHHTVLRARFNDRSQEERIRSGEMLALIARARGVGRLAIRLRPDPRDMPALCQEKGFRKVLCVGDGTGPEKPAVDGLRELGIAVELTPPYADREAARRELDQDGGLTEADYESTNINVILNDVPARDVDVLMIKGGGGDFTERTMAAIRLYKSGVGKYIFATGSGIQSYLHFGEIVAIIAGGYGIPTDRVLYDPDTGSHQNFLSVIAWLRSRGMKNTHTIVCTSAGAGRAYDGKQGPNYGDPDMKFYVWNAERVPFKMQWPPDHDEKVEAILAEMVQEIDRQKILLETGTPEEQQVAQQKLLVLGHWRYGALTSARFEMDVCGSCGRKVSFPEAPWDWDGIAPFPMHGREGDVRSNRNLMYGVVGLGLVKNLFKRNSPKAVLSLTISDYGSRGPWQEFMDTQITVVPDRWSRYIPIRGVE